MRRNGSSLGVADAAWMRRAIGLARRGYGRTSPNPMVGAVLVARGRSIGEGWHRKAGGPHAEVEALRDAARRAQDPRGATLYVTLEPCSTHGRTPPCTDAVLAAGVRRVVVAAVDPNPRHAGAGLTILQRAGIEVVSGVLEAEATALNEAFNHWIVHRTPWVLLKAAMSLDGKIATRTGESRWITGPRARQSGMRLRRGADAVLVGINTVLADDPGLTVRRTDGTVLSGRQPFRVILDSRARTPLDAAVVTDGWRDRTVIVTADDAPARRVAALRRQVTVWTAPRAAGKGLDLRWILGELGRLPVTSVLVEGGGEVHASFFAARCVHRVAFFYAPLVLGGREARPAVAGEGAGRPEDVGTLEDARWRRLGRDLFMTARVRGGA